MASANSVGLIVMLGASKGVTMTRTATVEFRDADMRRAWQEAIAAERQAEQHPERVAEQRRRLIRWVEARA